MRGEAISKLGNKRAICFHLVLLIVSFTLIGCGVQETQWKTWVSFGNSALNYPIWATVKLTNDGSSHLLFLNLLNGDQRKFRQPGVTFNGVQSLPNEPGKFIVSWIKSDKYIVGTYDVISGKHDVSFESIGTLIAPFQLNGKKCALSPTAKTEKGLYNSRIMCNGRLSFSKEVIEMFDYSFTSEGATYFRDKSNMVYYVAKTDTDNDIAIDKLAAPSKSPQYSFYFSGNLYVVEAKEPNSAFSLSASGFHPYSGQVVDSIKAAPLKGYEDILYFGDEEFVTAYPDDGSGEISISVWKTSGELIKTHTVDVVDE